MTKREKKALRQRARMLRQVAEWLETRNGYEARPEMAAKAAALRLEVAELQRMGAPLPKPGARFVARLRAPEKRQVPPAPNGETGG